MSDLFSRLTQTYSRLGALPSKLGDPRYHAIAYKIGNVTHPIEPKLKVVPISLYQVGRYISDSVQIMGDELVIQGIPRSYPQPDLEVAEYRVDTDRYRLVKLETDGSVSYNAIVTRMQSGK